jgi:hypothetical protein
MASVTSFIRNTPVASLRAYFDKTGIPLVPPVNWNAPEPDVVRPLLQAVDEMDDLARSRVMSDAERVTEIADEAGQAAIYSISQAPERLDELQNAHDRSLWVFLHDAAGFRRAEEVRYTDEHRRGRKWDGFIGQPNLILRRDQVAVDAFKIAIRERFQSNNVHIDIFDRQRPSFDDTKFSLVQVTIYREGRLDTRPEFVNGQLDRRPWHPVFEASITYECASGVIEVVANDRESREDLVRLFARDLLATEFHQQRLPLRQFDLRILQHPFGFPTEPKDGIEFVRVNSLRLMPVDTVGERVTLECMRQATQTIWQMAQERFSANSPLAGGWIVTQAKLTIRFHRDAGSRSGRTLPLTITMPAGCDLKDRTERERMIGEKYLGRWGIVRNV